MEICELIELGIDLVDFIEAFEKFDEQSKLYITSMKDEDKLADDVRKN